MANVLILTLVFPPDGVSTAQLMGELALDLARAGHRVTALTTMPHYNRDVEAESRQPIELAWHRMWGRSSFNGIDVIHIRMPRKGANVARRLAAWLGFHLISLPVALSATPQPHVILSPSPPLTIGIVAILAARFHGARFIYNVQEIYPDIAVQAGALRSPFLIELFKGLEKFVYRNAYALAVIGEGMKRNLLGKGVAPNKVRVIPNFVDVDDVAPVSRDNAFSREHGLNGRFVVSYAGNMGKPQGLDALVDAAIELRGDPRIHFLLLGNGSDRDRIVARVHDARLDNVTILEHQPYARVPEIYGASDLCVVPQLDGIGTHAAPSKVYRIMSAERPILAIARPEGDLGQLVHESGTGIVVDPRVSGAVAAAVRDAAASPDRLREMGRTGRRYVMSHVSRQHITAQYEALVREAARDAGDVAPSTVIIEHEKAAH